jgi:carbohydrate-selective porin OprB
MVAASICLAEAAIAREPDKAAGKADVAAAGSQGVSVDSASQHVHDRTSLPVLEEQVPAIDVSIAYTGEILGNTRGGVGRGARYLDNLDVTLTIDAERAFGWRAATLFAYGLYNNGRPFSDDLVGAAQGVSNIETGVRAARLYEAWIEQRFASNLASLNSVSMTSIPSLTRSRPLRCSSIRRTASVQTFPSPVLTGRRSFR